jgi:hypothetical protein
LKVDSYLDLLEFMLEVVSLSFKNYWAILTNFYTIKEL